MNQHDSTVLDPDVISSLKELGGPEDPGLFLELVDLFLEDTPTRLRELTEALGKEDPAGLERAAHALKSSAANLGAMELSVLFKEIESASREQDLERAASLVERSNDAYERVRAALRAETK